MVSLEPEILDGHIDTSRDPSPSSQVREPQPHPLSLFPSVFSFKLLQSLTSFSPSHPFASSPHPYPYHHPYPPPHSHPPSRSPQPLQLLHRHKAIHPTLPPPSTAPAPGALYIYARVISRTVTHLRSRPQRHNFNFNLDSQIIIVLLLNSSPPRLAHDDHAS